MSSSEVSTEVEQVREVLNLVENLRPHVLNLSVNRSKRIKVRIYTRTVRRTAYLDIDHQFRITRYGMVPKRAGLRTVEPVTEETLSYVPIVQLNFTRRTLIELLRQVSDSSVPHRGQ